LDRRRALIALALGQNFIEPLALNGKTSPCRLSHLLREFQPFSSLEIKDTPSG
jgi:hypothetical protein